MKVIGKALTVLLIGLVSLAQAKNEQKFGVYEYIIQGAEGSYEEVTSSLETIINTSRFDLLSAWESASPDECQFRVKTYNLSDVEHIANILKANRVTGPFALVDRVSVFEDENGVQEDPSDTLTLAMGLSPTYAFESYLGENPWTTYDGSVNVKVTSIELFSFFISDPSQDEVLEPIANDTWGRDVGHVFPDAPEEFENATDYCIDMTTGDDSSVYILVDSFPDYSYSLVPKNLLH